MGFAGQDCDFLVLVVDPGDAFIDMVEHFPDPPSELKSSLQTPPLELDPDTKVLSVLLIDSMRPNAMARVSDVVPADNLPPHVTYLIDLDLDLKKIQMMTRKFPMASNIGAKPTMINRFGAFDHV